MKRVFEQLFLAVVSVLARLTFFAYRVVVTGLYIGVGLGLIYAVLYWLCPSLMRSAGALMLWLLGGLALSVLVVLFTRARHKLDNPTRRYVGFWGAVDALVDRFIAWIGTIKYFTQPISLVADPGSYKIKGDEVRALIDGVLQPGDILLRGYDGYLDGVMIGLSGGGASISKHFSHAAFYAGNLCDNSDKPIVARRLQVMDEQGVWRDGKPQEMEAVRNNPDYYQSGPQRVIHSMTKGVFTEDILTFVRCDYLAVLRMPETMQLTAQEIKDFAPLFNDLHEDAVAIQKKLLSGQVVTREEVVKVAHLSALGKIGSCYDFQFSDSKTQHRFSCSEFVYYCVKSVHAFIGLHLMKHGFMNLLFVRETITPGDIYDAAEKAGKIQVVWKSRSLGA